MKKETILKTIAGVIAAMFFYASFSKLLDYKQSRWEMRNQIFPVYIADVLTWLVPVVEIIIIILLLYRTTRLVGLSASLGLLTAFTIYIAVALANVAGFVPCSCGGILNEMPYSLHIIFNLFFMALAFVGIWIEKGWKVGNVLKRIKNIWFNINKGWSNLWKKNKKRNVLQG